MNKRFGWTGKILRINLIDGKTSGLETDKYRDSYIGGRGIASRLYWENPSSEVSAFDPLSHLFFMTGPLAGTKAQAASRWIVLVSHLWSILKNMHSAILGDGLAQL